MSITHQIRNLSKLISRWVLAILLVWSLGYTIHPLTQSFTSKIFKPNVEQVQIHFESFNFKSLPKESKALSYCQLPNYLISDPKPASIIHESLLQVNSFVRNTFYVYTTINAP